MRKASHNPDTHPNSAPCPIVSSCLWKPACQRPGMDSQAFIWKFIVGVVLRPGSWGAGSATLWPSHLPFGSTTHPSPWLALLLQLSSPLRGTSAPPPLPAQLPSEPSSVMSSYGEEWEEDSTHHRVMTWTDSIPQIHIHPEPQKIISFRYFSHFFS